MVQFGGLSPALFFTPFFKDIVLMIESIGKPIKKELQNKAAAQSNIADAEVNIHDKKY